MPTTKNYNALRAILALGADRIDNVGKSSNSPSSNQRSAGELKLARGASEAYSTEQSSLARSKHVDELADELINAHKRRGLKIQDREIAPSLPAPAERNIVPLSSPSSTKPKSFARTAFAIAAVLLCALLVPIWLFANRTTNVASADLYSMPTDAVAMDFDGYYGDAIEKEKPPNDTFYKTKTNRERVTLLTSANSKLIRGTIGEGDKRFLVVGVKSRSADKKRDDLIITSVSQKTPATDADAPTIATYALTRDPDTGSYTGLATYWDDCNVTWIQCPYALEALKDTDVSDVDAYAKRRWPNTFGEQKKCQAVISPPSNQDDAKPKSNNPLLAVTEEKKKKSCQG